MAKQKSCKKRGQGGRSRKKSSFLPISVYHLFFSAMGAMGTHAAWAIMLGTRVGVSASIDSCEAWIHKIGPCARPSRDRGGGLDFSHKRGGDASLRCMD